MKPMHWPGSTAVLEPAAGITAVLTGESAHGRAGAGLTAGTALLSPKAGQLAAALAATPAARPPCGTDPDLFFAEAPDDVERAKSLCNGCPARLSCLAGALERREPWGVWGGELFLRGEILPRKRPRGRPRKDDVAA